MSAREAQKPNLNSSLKALRAKGGIASSAIPRRPSAVKNPVASVSPWVIAAAALRFLPSGGHRLR
jgi:hypothetical protein